MENTEKFTNKEFIDSIVEAMDYMAKEDYSHAITILNFACKHIPFDQMKDGKHFVSYNHFLEPYIYSGLYDETVERLKTKSYKTPVEYNVVYRLYGVALFKSGKIDEAVRVLEKSVEWNPISSQSLLDLAEIYKIKEDYEKFFELTLQAHKFAFERKFISKIFCNYGYYFTEKEDYETAVAMYILSDSYAPSISAANELKFISEKTGKDKFTRPTREEMKQICEDKGVYFGINLWVLEIMKALVERAKKDGNTTLAQNTTEAIFELTADRAVYDMLKKIRREGKKEMQKIKEAEKSGE